MSTSVRTRRTSERPATRPPPRDSEASGSAYETRTRYKDGVTTNDAPEWQSVARRPSNARSRMDDAKSGIAFRAPPVGPYDSISTVQSRAVTNGRKYSTISSKPQRPTFRQRSSSLDGTSWSGSGAPLTETNVRALNESRSVAREGTAYTTRKSRYASRRQSNAVSDDEQAAEERTTAQQTQRTSRRRTTVTGDDYEYGASSAAKSVQKSKAASTRKSSAHETELIAAGAGAAAVGAAAGAGARSRAPDDAQVSASRVSQRASQTRGAAQTEAAGTAKDRQISTRTTAGRRSRASSSSSSSSSSTSRPQRPAGLSDAMVPRSFRSDDADVAEWERRVYIREYRRPSDGKWVSDRECIIRRIRSPQSQEVAAEV